MSSKVSGFAAFVRLIGRSIGGIIMKRIKNKSLFAIVLSAFALSSCQDMPKVDDSLGSVEASSYAQSVTCSGGTSVPEILSSDASSSSTHPQASVREMDNGVIVIKQIDESVPLQGFSFRIDNLNEEFTLKPSDLTIKDTDQRILRGIATLFLTDINKDGYLDFAYTSIDGRSREDVGDWIGVYDFHNRTNIFKIDEPLEYNYHFTFEDHQIVVNKRSTDYYNTENVLNEGRLVGRGLLSYSDSAVSINWQNYLNADAISISITTADSSRTPMPLLPSQPPTEDQGVLIYPNDNTFIIEHAKVDKAYCITTTIVRNNGNYDDLTTALSVGYTGRPRFMQGTANNRQDNVVVGFLETFKMEDVEAQSMSIGICVSSQNYKIVFEFDAPELSPDTQNLMQAMGWSFTKQELVEFAHEFIPGAVREPDSEEDFPFMCHYVARNAESTKYSYSLLEKKVSEIDPALVDYAYSIKHYIYKTSSQTYTLNEHGAFVDNGGAFYAVLGSRVDFRYACNNADGYYRFRDEHTEITAQKRSPSGTKVLENANKIIFKRETVTAIEEREPDYKLTIASNTFEIMDYKTMIKGSTRYTAVSSYDFSPLYA